MGKTFRAWGLVDPYLDGQLQNENLMLGMGRCLSGFRLFICLVVANSCYTPPPKTGAPEFAAAKVPPTPIPRIWIELFYFRRMHEV